MLSHVSESKPEAPSQVRELKLPYMPFASRPSWLRHPFSVARFTSHSRQLLHLPVGWARLDVDGGVGLRELEGLVGDGVGGAACGEESEEGVVEGADGGDVVGAGIDDEEEVAVCGKRHGGRAVADVNSAGALAVIDGVDGDPLGTEVADIEERIVCGHDAVDGFGADEVGTADIVGAGDDFRDGVGERVHGEELAAIGFEGELHWTVADVEEGFDAVRQLVRRIG